MNARARVFTACALGGGFGAFLAHQVFYPSGWSLLLGFLAGGLLSYLTYDFRGVMAAIPRAWRKTVNEMRELAAIFVVFIILASNVPIIIGVDALYPSNPDTRLILAFILLVGFFTNLFRLINKYPEPRNMQETTISAVKWLNPFANILVGIPYLVFWIFKGIILFLSHFAKNVFILIHSELRLLCLFDGGMGAVVGTLIVGTLTGTLVGALAGGIFGVLNFEIVSKRILKLVPMQ